jgi:hypothetical protein
MALNLETEVDQLPAHQNLPRATAHRRLGLERGRAALVGVPADRILEILKDVILAERGRPRPCGAAPGPASRRSCLFNFGNLTKGNVEDWIGRVRRLGFVQLDNHGGCAHFFRFGDFALNREKWPRGWDDMREIVGRLRRIWP